ncbi:hypothetical protein VOI54_16890 [Tamlana sp. 2201CG12-4]|uniref:hypothetical protein n=1 Tax=Tamlana sp. 2201CG12-4 TaxID=3112582 RepID=UPI002DB7DA3F|nr:hypothetical protein [Tamlana sp. 2201CG12-4]MEC3908707.1 hypothetical protein [Tamlana sp. 2201CG12-4]
MRLLSLKKELLFLMLFSYVVNVFSQVPESDELMVIHKVTTSDMNAIITPFQGSIVYNTDHDSMFIYDGGQWLRLVTKKELITSLTGDYTLELKDNGTVLAFDSPNPATLTVPLNLPIGFNVSLYQIGDGEITIEGDTGVTIKNRLSRFKTAGKDAGVGIISTALNTFHITGDLSK